jgi:hypothetical protein
MHPSKSVSKEITFAPLETGWINWALETLSAGKKTMVGIPAFAE